MLAWVQECLSAGKSEGAGQRERQQAKTTKGERQKHRKGGKGCVCHGAPSERVQVNAEHFTLRKKKGGLNTQSWGKTLLSPVGTNRDTHINKHYPWD